MKCLDVSFRPNHRTSLVKYTIHTNYAPVNVYLANNDSGRKSANFGKWDSIFVVDVDAGPSKELLKAALANLTEFAHSVRNIGVYPDASSISASEAVFSLAGHA